MQNKTVAETIIALETKALSLNTPHMNFRIFPLGIFFFVGLLIQCPKYAKGQEIQRICNIKMYSYYTNLAELSIVDSAYSQALSYYDSAFHQIDSPFFRDRFNKMVCTAITGDYEKCRAELIYLIEKGLNRDFIKDNTALSAFLTSEYGQDIQELNIKPTYNSFLRTKYDSLVEADQLFRRGHKYDYREFYSDTISKIDASNVKYMNELIKEYGWPTIDNVGITDINYPQYQVIILHQGDDKYKCYYYADDLLNAYENCQIEPDRAQFLIAWSNSSQSPHTEFGLVTIVYDSLRSFQEDSLKSFLHKTGFLKIQEEEMAKINQEREIFGLEPINELRRKALFASKNKNFILQHLGSVLSLVAGNMKDYNYAISNLTEQ